MRFTGKVTYWVRIDAENEKEALKWLEKNPTDYQIEYVNYKILKHNKKLRYPKKMYETDLKKLKEGIDYELMF